MKNVIACLALFIGFVAMVVGFSALMAWPTMLLWNYSATAALPAAKPIDFWHAWGLLILSGFLFKSFSTNASKS